MEITFNQAEKKAIDQLIKLRIAYMKEDFGQVSDYEKTCMEEQLPDYFNRKLGTELIVFVARDGEKIVATAYLHIIEMPASVPVLTGFTSSVLNVYTEPEYRGRGICTKLIKNLVEYGKNRGLSRIDLSATKDGYPVYKKAGFEELNSHYTEMRMRF